MARGMIVSVIGTALVAWMTMKWFALPTKIFNPEEQISGKNVLVTGSSSGIGRQMALLLCEMGANVYVTARRENLLKQVVEECTSRSGPDSRHGYLVADMENMDQAANVVEEAAKFLGGIDYLILNHAYLLPTARFYEISDQGFATLQKVMTINFFSFVKMMNTAMPHLLKSAGRISVVSSDSGEVPHPLLTEYTASKFAVTGFFGAMDLDFYTRSTNVSITINIIGAIDTDGLNTFIKGVKHEVSDASSVEEAWPKSDPKDCAYNLIKAAALREPVTFYPYEFSLWGQNIMNRLFPDSFRDSIKASFS